jgi:hypothetical protein
MRVVPAANPTTHRDVSWARPVAECGLVAAGGPHLSW